MGSAKTALRSKKLNKIWIPLLGSVFVLISLALTYHVRPFNSDDVAWQNALLNWHAFNGQLLYWSPDTWVLKIPFYWVVSHIFGDNRRALFIEAALFAVTNFLIFYYATLYFVKKISKRYRQLDLIPLIWLSSFGFMFTRLFLNTNLRSIEIGLSFILFVLVAKLYGGELKPLKPKLGIVLGLMVCLVVGLLIYNDPYYLYFCVAPLSIFSAFLYLIKPQLRKQILIFFIGVVVSLISYKLIKDVGISAGIRIIPQQVQFATYDRLFPQIALTIQSVLTVFSADFTGRSVLNLITFGYLLNFMALIVGIYFIKSHLNRVKHLPSAELSDSQIWLGFFAITPLFMATVYALSSIAVSGTYRYLVMLPFFVVILLCCGLARMTSVPRNIVCLLLGLSIVFNLGTSFANAKHPSITGTEFLINRANTQNFDLIRALQSENLTKGYSQYWEANINTYLSKGAISVLPVVCTATDQTIRFNWMVNSARFASYSAKSFLVVDDDRLIATPQCSSSSLLQQFGPPDATIVSNDSTILIYNYDINTKIH